MRFIIMALALMAMFSTASGWNLLEAITCSSSSYGSYSSLSDARAACEIDYNCGFVLDMNCDNTGEFNLCPVGAPISPSIIAGSCVYEKGWNVLPSSHCDTSKYGSYSSLSDAKTACENDSICGFVYDDHCDNTGEFYLCPVGATISLSNSWGSCMYEFSMSWNLLQSSHCFSSKYGSHSSLSDARAACEIDSNCGFVYDANCDNRDTFYLCPVGATLSSSSAGSCMYEFSMTFAWNSLSRSHCYGEKYGSYETLYDAKAACENDSNCGFIYDGGCDNRDEFYLCRVGATVLSSTVGSCMHEKIGCRTDGGKNCVFPFVYHGIQFDSCTDYDEPNGLFWCATRVGDGNVLSLESNDWDFCDLNTCESETSWQCDIELLSDAGCDCGCGNYDFFCEEWDYNTGYNINRCPSGQWCDPDRATRCVGPDTPFLTWSCPDDWWNDGTCHCGCNRMDYDCRQGSECEAHNCPSGQAPSHDMVSCRAISPPGMNAPYTWNCDRNWYNDGICHCGCGVIDYDCLFAGSSECEVNGCYYSWQEPDDDKISCRVVPCRTMSGTLCQFPYEHDGVSLIRCTQRDNNDYYECPVQVDDNDVPIVWETCNLNTPCVEGAWYVYQTQQIDQNSG